MTLRILERPEGKPAGGSSLVHPPVTPQGVEPTYENVLAFLQQRGHASAYELQIAFKLSYLQAVQLLDALEARGAIPAIPFTPTGAPAYSGPRPLGLKGGL